MALQHTTTDSVEMALNALNGIRAKLARMERTATLQQQRIDQLTSENTTLRELRDRYKTAIEELQARGTEQAGAGARPAMETPTLAPVIERAATPTPATFTPLKPKKPRCTVTWCGNTVKTCGLCGTHYTRYNKYGDPYLVRKVIGRHGDEPEVALFREVSAGRYERVEGESSTG